MASIYDVNQNPDDLYPNLKNSIDFLKREEGFRPEVYLDSGKTPTVGYGFTGLANKTLSREDADKMIFNVLKNKRDELKASLGHDIYSKLTPGQTLALDDRIYNAGVPAVAKSRFLGHLKSGNIQDARKELVDWDRVTNKETGEISRNEGLQKRLARVAKAFDEQQEPVGEFENDPLAILNKLQKVEERKNDPLYQEIMAPRLVNREIDDIRMVNIPGMGENIPYKYGTKTVQEIRDPKQNYTTKQLVELLRRSSPELEARYSVGEEKARVKPLEGVETKNNVIPEELNPKGEENITDPSNIDNTKREQGQPLATPESSQTKFDYYQDLLNRFRQSRSVASAEQNRANLINNLARVADTAAQGFGVKSKADVVDAIAKSQVNPEELVDKDFNSELLLKKLQLAEQEAAEKAQTQKDIAKQYADAKTEAARSKITEQEEKAKEKLTTGAQKRFDTISTQLKEELAKKSTGIGRLENNLQMAEDISALIGNGRFDDLNNLQLKELAMSVNALLSPGAPSIRTTEALTAKTFLTDFAKVKSYIAGAPQSANAGDYVKFFKNLADRQTEVNARLLKDAKLRILTPHLQDETFRNLPETQAYLSVHDIKPEEVEKALAGGYAKQNIAKERMEKEKQSSYTEEDKAAIKWAKSNLDNPKAQAFLKKMGEL